MDQSALLAARIGFQTGRLDAGDRAGFVLVRRVAGNPDRPDDVTGRVADKYAARMESATLDELHAAADALQAGVLRADLATALVDGTSVGGARPKVLIADGDTQFIAKLSTSTDGRRPAP